MCLKRLLYDPRYPRADKMSGASFSGEPGIANFPILVEPHGQEIAVSCGGG